MMNRMRKLFFLTLILVCAHLAQAQTIKSWKLEDLQTAIATADKPTIFNFWATFCKPCIEEIPYFQQLVKQYDSAGVRLVLVNLDAKALYPAKIKAFAQKRKFTAPIFFLDETDADKFCPAVDEKWSGAIPASLFVNNAKGYRAFFEEQLSRKELEQQIKNMLQ
jgi:thiol-disulfide isomerase/thioredoxin